MSEELIREISLNVVNDTLQKSWYLYFIMLCIGFIAAYFMPYIKGYATERAKNTAIKADLEDIKTTLQETTKVTEKIKNDLEHEVWRKKAIESVKREKLEEYFNLVFAAKESLYEQMMSAFFYHEENYDKYAFSKADILQKLYFPELGHQHAVFKVAVSEYLNWIADGRGEMVVQMENGVKKPNPSKNHMAQQPNILNTLNNSLQMLTDAGKQLAESLNS